MGTTPTLALPYPEASDPADVPTDIHELATALDTLVHKTTYGTTPPASPNDGDEWILPVDATNGVMWRFRYRAASASAYKWEFIGGSLVSAEVATTETTTTTGTYVDLATVGPSIILPRNGDYQVNAGCNLYHTTAANAAFQIAVCLGATATYVVNPASAQAAVANVGADGGQAVGRYNNAVLGAELRLRYYNVVAGTAAFRWRWIRVWPVRVS
jgi:hypothetical protein